jgi:hypothetical protein
MILCLTIAGGVLIILFWILYFCDAIVLSESDNPLVGGFEEAFPFADGILGTLLVLSGLGILRRKLSGTFFLIAAAAMTLYLGVVDITFYSRHGLYLPITTGSAVELFINTMCIGGGLVGLRFGWKLWRRQCRTLTV